MSNYEIREDSSNKHWPFEVWNLTDGRMVNRRFPSKEDAQAYIDEMSAMMDFNSPALQVLANVEEAWTHRFETQEVAETGVEPVAEEVADLPEEIIIAGENEVGITVEYKGSRWLVTDCQNELIIADDEDAAFDEHVIGWHSWLKKVS